MCAETMKISPLFFFPSELQYACLFLILFPMDSLNWLAIGAGTIVTFVLGHVWYGFIFGKLWMKIHHGDATFTDEQMQEMMQ
jgi:hypothetical protein